MLAHYYQKERLVTMFRPRTLVALMSTGLLLVVGLAVGSETSVGSVAAVALACATTTAAVAARFGLRRLTLGLGVGATAMVPWVGVRAGPEVAASDVVLLTAIVVALVYRLTQPGFSVTPYILGFIAIAFVVAGGLLGTFFASDPTTSLVQLARFAASAIGVLVYFCLLSPTRREVLLFGMAFVLGAMVSAGIGILFIDPTYGRPVGLSFHSNHLGMVVFMAIGVLLGVSRSGERRLGVAGLVVLPVAAVYTGSRTSIIGVICTGLIFLWATKRLILLRRLFVAMTVAVTAWSVGWVSLPATNAIDRLLGEESATASNAERAEATDVSLQQIREHPITGSGFGAALEAHSIYLQLWQGGGVLAITGLGILWVVSVQALRAGRRRGDELAIGLCSAYLAYLLVAAVANQLWDRYLWVVFALMIAAKAAPDPEGARVSRRRDEVARARA